MAAVPPPPKPPKPGRILVYKALYNYNAQNADELSFNEDDILYVTDASANSGWWRATCKGKCGLIPFNYVSENAESIENPLHEAARRGNLEFMDECLINGVSVNSLDRSGSPALYWAAHGGHVEALKKLLSIPLVHVSAQNKLGDSPLHACSWKGHAECAQLLLDAGCDPSLKNTEGKTAAKLAVHPEVAALLKRYARTNEPTNDEEEYFDDSD